MQKQLTDVVRNLVPVWCQNGIHFGQKLNTIRPKSGHQLSPNLVAKFWFLHVLKTSDQKSAVLPSEYWGSRTLSTRSNEVGVNPKSKVPKVGDILDPKLVISGPRNGQNFCLQMDNPSWYGPLFSSKALQCLFRLWLVLYIPENDVSSEHPIQINWKKMRSSKMHAIWDPIFLKMLSSFASLMWRLYYKIAGLKDIGWQ